MSLDMAKLFNRSDDTDTTELVRDLLMWKIQMVDSLKSVYYT